MWVGQKRSPFLWGNIAAGFGAMAHQLTPFRLAGNITVRGSRLSGGACRSFNQEAIYMEICRHDSCLLLIGATATATFRRKKLCLWSWWSWWWDGDHGRGRGIFVHCQHTFEWAEGVHLNIREPRQMFSHMNNCFLWPFKVQSKSEYKLNWLCDPKWLKVLCYEHGCMVSCSCFVWRHKDYANRMFGLRFDSQFMMLRIKIISLDLKWVVCLAAINLSIVEKQDNFDRGDPTEVSTYPSYLPTNYFKNPQSLAPSGLQAKHKN